MEFRDLEVLYTKKVLEDFYPKWDGNTRTSVVRTLRRLVRTKILEVVPGSLRDNFEEGHSEESNLVFFDRNSGFYLWYSSMISRDEQFDPAGSRDFTETIMAEVPRTRGVSPKNLEKYAEDFRKTHFPGIDKPI